MSEENPQDDRTLKKPSDAGESRTLLKPPPETGSSPEVVLKRARAHYLSLRRVIMPISLFVVIWYLLPKPFLTEETEGERDDSGTTVTQGSEESPTPMMEHLQDGIFRTRGGWAAHPILSIVTYIVLHGNVVALCIALIMLGPGIEHTGERVVRASRLGLGSGFLLWTVCWGYDQWGGYLIVLAANAWFMAAVFRNTKIGQAIMGPTSPRTSTPTPHAPTRTGRAPVGPIAGSLFKNYRCRSCGNAYTNVGRSSSSNKAIGGARCRDCGAFYCESCVSRELYSRPDRTFTCACGRARVIFGGKFNNFDELVVFRS